MPSATVPVRNGQQTRRARAGSCRSRAAKVQHALGNALRNGRLPALLVTFGALALLYGFMFSNDFLIASVEVRGTQLGDSAEVAQVADALGESIFRIDAGHAAQRVATLSYVESVTVETRFPDRVVLTVRERVPAIVWRSGTDQYLVDGRGFVIGPAQASALPVLTIDDVIPVSGASVDSRLVAAALAIHEALENQLESLSMTSGDGFTATLIDGRTVVFGESSETSLKLSIFSEVEQLGEPWSLLDLREPGRPYYK